MKIAIVHEMLVKLGGAERVAKKLSEMFPEAPIYTLIYDEEKVRPWFEGKKIIASRLQSAYKILGNHRMLLPWMAGAIENFDFGEYDLVISSSSAFAHGIKTKAPKKHLCYCHSPMRYAWDYAHEYTKKMNPISRTAAALILNKNRIWDLETANRPDKILVNSAHVQKRVAKYWRKKADIVYPPVNIGGFKVNPKHHNYFLILSALTPFKKIDLAIKAFNRDGHHLIIIGQGPEYFRLRDKAKENVELLGYKPDAVAREILEGCRALIFPGEEDFGIAPIEAMASGKPVLAYRKGGCVETIQEGINGEFFDEPNMESLIDGLHRLIANEKIYDPHHIRKTAERFDETTFEKNVMREINRL